MKMKKTYMRPKVEEVKVEAEKILCASLVEEGD